MRSCRAGLIALNLGLLTSCAANGAGFGAVSFGAPEIRMAGLDRDPGWVPAAGRVISFHFE